MTTDNMLIKVMVYNTIKHPNCKHSSRLLPSPHLPVEHLIRRNRFLTQWYYRHGPSVRYLLRREEPDATPAVGSPGALCSTPFSQSSLTNSTCYKLDHQMAHNRSSQWLYALKDTVSSGVIANTPISTLTDSSLTYGG